MGESSDTGSHRRPTDRWNVIQVSEKPATRQKITFGQKDKIMIPFDLFGS
jgi:hypothetical protein